MHLSAAPRLPFPLFLLPPFRLSPVPAPCNPFRRRSFGYVSVRRLGKSAMVACLKMDDTTNSPEIVKKKWEKVSAVLFDMDGVICDSEELSRMAAVDFFREMGVEVTPDDFVPFMGTGEANFLGGVASLKGIFGFVPEDAKKRFFEIYLEKYAKPNSGIEFSGALELINQCKMKGLKVAVASSADRIKVDANLAAASIPLSIFDAVVSADAFENLKPSPDIFLASSKILNVPPGECVVIEDALAGIEASKSAQMRCIAVTTTLSEEILRTACPSLIRKEIGDVSLDDILNCGSSSLNENMTECQSVDSYVQALATLPIEVKGSVSPYNANSADCSVTFPVEWLQGSRRNILKYGSLGIAISCLFFTFSNRKALQYASPKGFWNLFFPDSHLTFKHIQGESQSARIQKFVNYISDVETRKTASIVPDFPAKLDWLNSVPLHLSRDLKGKVVLLDFWTYCCINCMHVLPDLEFLERKYKNMPLVVVGVHSAKFDNERSSEAIRNAVLRYNISHPVVNDDDMFLWKELGVNSWPTIVIVGPTGRILAQISGEGHRQVLDELVEAALIFYGKRIVLDSTPISLRLEKDNDPSLLMSPLKFPGKLEVDVVNRRLFISDSNHNRIVVTDLNGHFIVQIGSTGEDGLNDGSFDDAMFNRPQGLAYNAKKNILYVADTENHALREVDFVNETVRTIAGNGTKGSDYKGGKKGTAQLLNSPWDVCFEPVKEIVYIAMAGQHQIWEHNTFDGVTSVFSGDGYERNLNGSSSASTSFAQPSGISLSRDSKEIYVADSESSSIRAVDINTGGSRLLAGGNPIFADDLFKFGDHDGSGTEVLLQHPMGIICGNIGLIYIADSYNHKIKKIDPETKIVTTLAGTGKAGFVNGTSLLAQLSEPSGIVEAENGRLLIADTNNNVIRYLDLNKEGVELVTLELKEVHPPARKARSLKRLRRRSSADTKIITVMGGSSSSGNLLIHISVPDGFHLSKEARSKFSVEFEPENAVSIDPLDGNLSPDGSAVLHFRRSASSAKGRINCMVYYCKEDEVCLYQSLAFEVPFQEEAPNSMPADIALDYIVEPKTTTGLQLSVTR